MVEYAINFFKSVSFIKPNLLIIKVLTLKNFKILRSFCKQYLYCNKINTPATTKVEEWTKEEIGVGALIAANNQELKGNWALFTTLPITKVLKPKIRTKFIWTFNLNLPTINKTKNISPKRFWNKVNNPLLILSWFI